MTLADQIIDTAEELAVKKILCNPRETDILNTLRELTGVQFADNSTCARLGLAAYNRMENARQTVDSLAFA